MIDIETVRQFALALPGTDEYDHFGRPAFRANKLTYTTIWVAQQKVVVKLSLVDQSVFSAFNPAIIYPVPNKWGLKGYTFFELNSVRQDMLEDAITTAYQAAIDRKTIRKK